MLSVVMADRPEDLLPDLVRGLSAPPADPFQGEWVSVPSLGFRNWLQQQLSQRLGANDRPNGITANIEMPFPGALRWLILNAHRAHVGGADVEDPWRVDRLVWTVLEVLSEVPAGLDARLTNRSVGVPLAGRAGPIADLFDRYMVHRPEMVAAWLQGRDHGPDGVPLEQSRRWQPGLFRAVHERISVRHGVATTPAERLVEALQLLRSGELALDRSSPGALPPRLFVFGQSILTSEMGPVLDALAVHRQVTALLLSPSAFTSRRCADSVAVDRPPVPASTAVWTFPRSHSLAQLPTTHHILGTWGTRPLESALMLGAGGLVPEVHERGESDESRLLWRIQADIHRGSVSEHPLEVGADDDSVQIHAAPGRTRQVEVLRDAILALLRDNPDLAESDIAVVCPQLDQYAPILTGVLGPSAERHEQPMGGRAPNLRYTIVDRSARSFNPVLDAMATLLEVLPGRFDVTSVRGLLQSPAVRGRFGLGADDLALLSDWTEGARVRWGLDGQQRLLWNVGSQEDVNSWVAGVDQLMMGVALGDDLRDAPLPGQDPASAAATRTTLAVGGVAPLPLDDHSIGGAGRLAAAMRSLARVHELLSGGGSRTAAEWCRDLLLTADLMVAPARLEEWQRTRFDALLEDLVTSSLGADGVPSAVQLDLADVRRLLAPALEGSKARADLGFGSVVVARPALLASVPFRVVCILGLDADSLPVGRSTGDDLLPAVPMVGDRDLRAEARAELLAAVLSAREHLIVTCSSRDVRSNAVVPDAVVLDELLELVAATVGLAADGLRDGAAGVVRTHHRQAFDPRNYQELDGVGPFGFDPVACAGAGALRAARTSPRPGDQGFLDGPLAEYGDPDEPVELDHLRRFFEHPVRTFFWSRLSVDLPDRSDESESELPTSVGPLDTAAIGRELLGTGLTLANVDDVLIGPDGQAGHPDVANLVRSIRARGILPPPSIADPILEETAKEVAGLLQSAEQLGVRRSGVAVHPVDVELVDGTRLVGSVGGCVAGEDAGPLRLSFTRPKPHHRVAMAVNLLALTLADPSTNWRGVVIGRPASDKDAEPVVVVQRVAGEGAPGRRETASAALALLVDQYRDGLRFPLPLFDATSWEMHVGGGPAKAWGDPARAEDHGESSDPYHVMTLGSVTYSELLEHTPGGYSPRNESDRLWGTLAQVLISEPLHGDPT